MKEYKRIRNTNAHKVILSILETHEKMKGCYFWTSPKSATSRRRMEDEHTHELEFAYEGKAYQVASTTTCSCKNIFYSLSVRVDGKKKDVRTLRRLIGA